MLGVTETKNHMVIRIISESAFLSCSDLLETYTECLHWQDDYTCNTCPIVFFQSFWINFLESHGFMHSPKFPSIAVIDPFINICRCIWFLLSFMFARMILFSFYSKC